MEAYRFIVRPNSDRIEITLPQEFIGREIEVLILPANDIKEQTKTAPSNVSKIYNQVQYVHRSATKMEALEFLSGCLADQ